MSTKKFCSKMGGGNCNHQVGSRNHIHLKFTLESLRSDSVKYAFIPSGNGSQCSYTAQWSESTVVLYEQKQTEEGIGLTTIAIAIWTGTMSQPNIPSKGKINYRYKGSEEGVVSS